MTNNIIKNYPAYANEYNYVVARWVEGDYWFWGAYDDYAEANRVAMELGNGCVFSN